MKICLIFLVLFNLCLLSFTDDVLKKSVVWHTDLDVALKASQESKKNILIVFSGSDWCVNCIKLKKKVLDTPAFEAFAMEQLTLLNLDFPSDKKNALPAEQVKKNEALAAKYNPEGSFPLCIILSSEGKLIGKIKSYSQETPEKYIEILKELMAKKQ